MSVEFFVFRMSDQIEFKKIGDTGSTLLMLHGWKHSHYNLLDLAKFLAKDYQVYLLDLPGFGKAPMISEDSSTSDYVDFIKNFIEQEKITPVLIGHSFGGRISVKLAAEYPELLDKKLVLIGTPGFPRRKNLYQTLRVFSLKYLAKILKLIDSVFSTKFFQNYFVPKFGSADYQQAGSLRKLLVKTVNENLSSFAEQIKLKTLLLWGETDEQAGLEQAHSYHSAIKDSELRIVKYHGHEPFADVGAHYCAKIIREFLKS